MRTARLVNGYIVHEPSHSTLEDPMLGEYGTLKEKGRYANLLLDDWFKRSFGNEKRKRLLLLLLQELIPERDIQDLTFSQQEHTNDYPGKKDIRVDIECTDKEGARFIVELQVAPQNWIYERALYYSSFAVIQQLDKGVDEYKFPPVYFIGILNFSLHPDQKDRPLYRYDLCDPDTGELMTDRVHYIFLELPNCRKARTAEATLLDNFCYALHNMQFLDEKPREFRQEIFDLLFESADITKFTAAEKIKYDYDMTTERDRRNQLKKATEDALTQGIAEGRAKGIAEGRAEGIAEGRAGIVKELLASGMTLEQLKERLHLSKEDLSILEKQNTEKNND